MTKAEWLACADPTRMLTSLAGQSSERKLRLFGITCARRWPGLFPDGPDRAVLDTLEHYADGSATRKGVGAMVLRALHGDEWDGPTVLPWSADWWETVTYLLGPLDHIERFAERVTWAVHHRANDREAVLRAPGG